MSPFHLLESPQKSSLEFLLPVRWLPRIALPCVTSKGIGHFVSRETIKTSAMSYRFCITQILKKHVFTRVIVCGIFIDVVVSSSSQRVPLLGAIHSRTTSLLLATSCSASGAPNNGILPFFVRIGSTGGVVRSEWVCVPGGAHARRNWSSKGGGGYPRLDDLWGRNGGQSLDAVSQPLFAVLFEARFR